ncbi:hypothetical protein SALBM311S_09342 [Streptomyces alboniger]
MEASAQCRSSRTTTTVRSAATRSSSRAVSSKRRAMPSSSCRPGPARRVRQQPGELLFLAGGRGREFVRQFAAQGTQGGGEGGERQTVGADLDTAAECDDGTPAAGGGGELLDQAGLADTGLAAEQ